MTDNSENIYPELPPNLENAGAPITIMRTDRFNRLITERNAYHVLLNETIAFIDAFQDEQADYSSIGLEELAATLRKKIARAIVAGAS